jgi:Glycosyl transferase family 2
MLRGDQRRPTRQASEEARVRRFLAPPAPVGLEPGPPPTFSIVIAAYQAAATIAEAVESALTQTMAPLEVIVVDDGSTDDTQDALASYGEQIIRVRQENRGAPAAKNVGIRKSTGDFVSILDADDVYEPERIAALTELATERPDLDILMTDAYLEVGTEVVGRFCEHTPFAVAEQNLAIFERCFFATPAVRRETMIAIGGFDESMPMGEDWECWIRLLHEGSLSGLVDEPLMRYRMGGPSLTANRVASLRSRVTVLERASRLDLSAEERRALARYLPRRRRRALLAEAEQALREGRADARQRAMKVAFAASMSPSVRVAALAAVLAPRAAARRLAVREAQTGYSRIERRVPQG